MVNYMWQLNYNMYPIIIIDNYVYLINNIIFKLFFLRLFFPGLFYRLPVLIDSWFITLKKVKQQLKMSRLRGSNFKRVFLIFCYWFRFLISFLNVLVLVSFLRMVFGNLRFWSLKFLFLNFDCSFQL